MATFLSDGALLTAAATCRQLGAELLERQADQALEELWVGRTAADRSRRGTPSA